MGSWGDILTGVTKPVYNYVQGAHLVGIPLVITGYFGAHLVDTPEFQDYSGFDVIERQYSPAFL